MPQLDIEQLYKVKGETLRSRQLDAGGQSARITVHMGTCGISSGADKVLERMKQALDSSGRKDISIVTSGCAGICNYEPLVTIERPGEEPVKYAQVSEEKANEIFKKHVSNGQIDPDLAYSRGWEQTEEEFEGPSEAIRKSVPGTKDLPFFGMQQPVVMKNRGLIQADRIGEYIAMDGYFAAAKALFQMEPAEIINEVKNSGIRGRGGAGFPTGLKWQFAAQSKSDIKYVLCNADEGDPGAFMDRCVLESDPHAVIEGMIIAARAIGSHQGFIYCRAEYPLAVSTLNHAIGQARELGLLGKNILNSGFDFDLEVYRGAGAFVCGEETALMTSIEGKRGTPRPRPPFPAVQGLWKKPSILNNVETLANIPQIILKGGRWYAGIGTRKSRGTKVFALTGDVNNIGLVEVPMGIPIGTIIHDIGGGIPKGKKFKAVQLGGPSGGCIPVEHLNSPVDYESISQLGAIVGSGGMIVMDEDKCVVDIARFFMDFCKDESCGKCTPCRVGTRKMLDILTKICEGRGEPGDIQTLEKWAEIIKNTALCGLGQTAPNPVLSTLRYFRHEYEAHIYEKHCDAAVCQEIVKAPCRHTCPVEMDVPAYIALVRAGRLDEAYKVLLRTNPFPSVCGRVCDHRCESKCRRSTLDVPVGIRHLKRFITDHGNRPPVKKIAPSRKEKIAVIGAGPSGLALARDLALRGYGVTVFEQYSEPGGMLRWAIPEYRLPKEILKKEIDDIVGLGVELRCGTRLGTDVTWQDIKRLYDAVYVATGTPSSMTLDLPGGNLEGIIGAIEFLYAVNAGKSLNTGKKVAVIGGGNSAVDAARSALRMGTEEVNIIYRRRMEDMPALEEEIQAAEEEGVRFICLAAPLSLEGTDGKLRRVKCQRMTLGAFDRSGRKRPQPVLGDEFVLDADQLIVAVGQKQDVSLDQDIAGVKKTDAGLISVKGRSSTRTSETMVFAGGDVVTGPATVVEAIAAGRRAAAEIDEEIRRKNGEESFVPYEEEIEIPVYVEEEVTEMPRAGMPEAEIKTRIKDFREVELGYDHESAAREAGRCLRCDIEIEE
ncbi:MAG: NADH-quinone oxidoreductase subunit NuoF [Desulfobacteraceae bacterium]|nr:NADH-quinone oxidoreductase subunit NuoF [Desulfobacteraceae bacterium]